MDQDYKLSSEGQVLLVVSGSPEVLYVRVPRLPRAGDCLAAITALLRLLEEGSATASWTVDLSELHSPPLSLVGVLVGLRSRFRERGRELRIVGMHPMLAAGKADDMGVKGRSAVLTTALAAN